MTVTAPELGRFAPDAGPPSPLALAGLAAGIATVGAIEARGLALPIGALAAALSLAGLYHTGTTGRRGRAAALTGLGLAVGGGVAAVATAALRGGDVDLSGIGDAYFNGEVLSLIWRDVLRAAVNTIKLAAISQALGLGLGLVVATLLMSRNRLLRMPAVVYVDIVRGLPLLMLLVLVFFGPTFIGIQLSVFWALVVGFTINSSAYVAEIFRSGFQSIDRGQMDAARSLGMPYPTAMMHVLIPQAVRRVIPPLTNEFILLLKDTSLAIILGSTPESRELMAAARNNAAATFSATPYMAASLAYLSITLPLTRLVNILERRLRAGEG